MTKLDSTSAILDWMQKVLLEVFKGIKGTWLYWYKRKDGLEELTK